MLWARSRFWGFGNRLNPFYEKEGWRLQFRLQEEYYRRLGWPKSGVCEEFDHRIELADGGPNTLENVQTLCSRCHCRKTVASAAARRLKAASKKQNQHKDQHDQSEPSGRSPTPSAASHIGPARRSQDREDH
jgi:hypothetical protein